MLPPQAGVIQGITAKMLKVRLADSDQQVSRLHLRLMDPFVVESHNLFAWDNLLIKSLGKSEQIRVTILGIANDIVFELANCTKRRFGIELTQLGRVPNQKYDATEI